MIALLVLPAISTGAAVLLGGAGALAGSIGAIAFGLAKLRPERESLIAQASEHATAAMSKAFERLELDLKQALSEVDRLNDRERDLIRRINDLEDAQRQELQSLREHVRELLAHVAELELQLAARPPAD